MHKLMQYQKVMLIRSSYWQSSPPHPQRLQNSGDQRVAVLPVLLLLLAVVVPLLLLRGVIVSQYRCCCHHLLLWLVACCHLQSQRLLLATRTGLAEQPPTRRISRHLLLLGCLARKGRERLCSWMRLWPVAVIRQAQARHAAGCCRWQVQYKQRMLPP
jgi:hypothetical protein